MKKALILVALIAIFTVPTFAGVDFGARMIGNVVTPQITIDLNQGFVPALTVFKADLYQNLKIDGTYIFSLTWNAPFITYKTPGFTFALSFYFGGAGELDIQYPAMALSNGYAVIGGKIDCGENGALFAEIMIDHTGSYITSIGGSLSLPSLSLPSPAPPAKQ